MLREIGVETDEAESVIQISYRVQESGVAFLYDMLQGVFGSPVQVLFSQIQLFPVYQLLVLLQMRFDLSEFVQKSLVLQNFYVFHVVVGLLSALELFLGFPWVDSFQDAETSRRGKDGVTYLKSFRESCSFLIALVLVIYWVCSPRVPFFIYLPINN